MSKRRLAVGIAVTGAIAGTAFSLATTSANGDAAPGPQDIVGVGSDIVQNSLDFLSDGSPDGQPGYNTAGNRYRVFSFDASADANGRGAFTDPALGTSTALNPTAVLRAGTSPVQRPNGGGAGITALVSDGSNQTSANLIQFVRSPNLPTSANQTTAQANLGTSLHTIQFADDKQYIATAATTNAPAAGLSNTDLAHIYCTHSDASQTWTTWGQLPGYTGSAPNATIIPERPQDSAGVLKMFAAQLKAGNGNVACTYNSNVVAVQQNDPSTITANADPADVIVPFPKGRYTLLGQHYFLNPNTAYAAGANGKPVAAPVDASGIKLQIPGQNGVSANAFIADIPYYVIFRESDASSDAPWQPGSTLNWVQTLFYNPAYDPDDPSGPPAPWVESEAADSLLTSLGLTPVYNDLGNQTNG